jgi:hypothetical protein
MEHDAQPQESQDHELDSKIDVESWQRPSQRDDVGAFDPVFEAE